MWFIWALLSAFVSSVSVVFNKKTLKHISSVTLSLAIFLLPIPILLLLALNQKNDIQWEKYVIGILGTGGCFVIAKTVMFEAIKQSSLSKIYPLFSITTFFTYLFGLIFLHEHIKLLGIIGIFLTILGTYLINIDQAKEDILLPFKLLMRSKESIVLLFSLLLSSLTSVFDKTAIQSSNIIVAYLGGNIVSSSLLIVYSIVRKKRIADEFKTKIGSLFIASMIYMILVLLVYSGFAAGPIALVSGVKKLELLFVLFFSWIFFHDKPSKHSFIASICMLMGIVFMKI